jgi:xylulokinase
MDEGTTRADLARAAVQALAFTIRRSIELLVPGDRARAGSGAASEVVLLTGGGAREAVVQQLLADVLGRDVQRVEVRSSSATGAALLAARGTGGRLAPLRRRGPVVVPAPTPTLAADYERWLARVPVADA